MMKQPGEALDIEDARSSTKFLVIMLICTMGLGFTMVLNSPTSLREVLIKEMRIGQHEFKLQYYMLFWPNIFSWLSGFLIDRYLDLRLMTVIFVTISCVGCTMFTIGGVTKVYLVMVIGRLITGLGAESAVVCMNCYIFKWFPAKLSNTVFALSKSVPLLGSILIFQITDSLLSRLLKTFDSKHAFSIIVVVEMGVIVLPLATAVVLALISRTKQTRGKISQILHTIQMKNILNFPTSFWFLAITANIFFSSCLIFLRLNTLPQKYGLNMKQTEMLINAFIAGSCLMGPILGFIVDWKGRHLTFITLAILGGITSHFSFLFIMTDPFYPILLLSLSYSTMTGSYWSLFKLNIKPHELSTALGIEHSMLMLFCAVVDTAAPRLKRFHNNALEGYYLLSMIVALVGCCILWGLNCKDDIYNLPKTVRSRSLRRLNTNRKNCKNNRKVFNNRGRIIFIPGRANEAYKSESKRKNDSMYIKLKRIEAEGNLYKHQRKRRQRNKTIERRRSKSNEDLSRI